MILVGEILKAHGIRGEVAVHSLSENPARFQTGSVALVGADPGEAQPMVVAGSRMLGTDRALVRFEGVDDRTQAEALRGSRIFAAAEDLPQLPEDTYWEKDLVGLAVVDGNGRHLGTVTAVLSRAEQDLWEVETSGGPVLVPAAKGIVTSVDLPGRMVVVDPPPGLFGPA
jgi:16S rRNA processing protein RimM